jgi:ligand-binding sensor domain-containing protein
MKPIYFVVIVLNLMVQFCFADDFRYLRTNEGLYTGEINSTAQDQSGKMWFATWSGLASYNGFDFKFYRPELGNPLSLSDKKDNKIFIDSKDNLWVASLSGVSVFRKTDQTFHSVHLQGMEGKGYYVFNFKESKGHVLIQTSAGIFLMDKTTGQGEGFHSKKLKLYNGNNESFEFAHYLNTFKDQLVIVSNADSYNPTRILLGELIVNKNDTLISLHNRIVYPGGINATAYVKEEDQLYLGTSNGISVLSLSNLKINESLYFKNQNIQNLL